MALLDKLSSYAKSQAKAYSNGNKQTEGLGAEPQFLRHGNVLALDVSFNE